MLVFLITREAVSTHDHWSKENDDDDDGGGGGGDNDDDDDDDTFFDLSIKVKNKLFHTSLYKWAAFPCNIVIVS